MPCVVKKRNSAPHTPFDHVPHRATDEENLAVTLAPIPPLRPSPGVGRGQGGGGGGRGIFWQVGITCQRVRHSSQVRKLQKRRVRRTCNAALHQEDKITDQVIVLRAREAAIRHAQKDAHEIRSRRVICKRRRGSQSALLRAM